MIHSTRATIPPNQHGQVFLVCDTTFAGKRLFTACGIGRIKQGEPLTSEVAQSTLMALMEYADRDGDSRLHIVEVATEAAAPMRIRKALEQANDKERVFFLCRSPAVYDAAFFALNVDMRDPGTLQ